jgi:hypothetical protein
MAQSDQVVQNATFPSVRADINDNLAALYSQSSGNSAPAVTVAFQPWIDTSSSPPVKKVRNGSNTAWITESILDPAGIVTPIANGGTGATTATAALAALLPSQSGNAGKALVTDGSAAAWNTVSGITNSTAVTSTSGTAIDFTGIPSTAKQVTVMFKGVRTNGASVVEIRIGSGTVVATGYYNQAAPNGLQGTLGSVTGFNTENTITSSNSVRHGSVVLTLIGSNTWTAAGHVTGTSSTPVNNIVSLAGSSPALSGALDRVRITTQNGTDVFNAGTINISWAS